MTKVLEHSSERFSDMGEVGPNSMDTVRFTVNWRSFLPNNRVDARGGCFVDSMTGTREKA